MGIAQSLGINPTQWCKYKGDFMKKTLLLLTVLTTFAQAASAGCMIVGENSNTQNLLQAYYGIPDSNITSNSAEADFGVKLQHRARKIVVVDPVFGSEDKVITEMSADIYQQGKVVSSTGFVEVMKLLKSKEILKHKLYELGCKI